MIVWPGLKNVPRKSELWSGIAAAKSDDVIYVVWGRKRRATEIILSPRLVTYSVDPGGAITATGAGASTSWGPAGIDGFDVRTSNAFCVDCASASGVATATRHTAKPKPIHTTMPNAKWESRRKIFSLNAISRRC